LEVRTDARQGAHVPHTGAASVTAASCRNFNREGVMNLISVISEKNKQFSSIIVEFFKKVLDFFKRNGYNVIIAKLKKGKTKMFSKKKQTKKQREEAEIARADKRSKLAHDIVGMINFTVMVAQAAAAYILYFNESPALKVIAVILAANAAVTGLKQFTK